MATIRIRKQQKGRFYYLYWWERGRDGVNRQRSKSLGSVKEITARQAEALRAEKERDLGRQRDRTPPTPLFRDFAREYLSWRAREYPSSQYRIEQLFQSWLIPVLGEKALGSLTPRDLERYKVNRIKYAVKEPAPATVGKEVRAAKALMNWAVKMKVLTESPWADVSPPKDLNDAPPRYFTIKELKAIYEAAKDRAPWWRFMANTGLRRTEALRLRWDRVGRDMITVVSTNQARSKSGKSRVVPLNNSARAALEIIRGRNAHSKHWHEDFVLPQMNPRSFTRSFGMDAAKAGVDGTIQDLRHTFGVHMAMSPTTRVRALQKIMGHAKIATTEGYMVIAGRDIERDVEGIAL